MEKENSEKMMKVEIPQSLHQAIIRIQAAENLHWPRACLRAAVQIDTGREEFSKAVQEKAEGEYKSKLMKSLNKGREKIRQNAYDRGWLIGHQTSFQEAEDDGFRRFPYPCCVCKGTIYAEPENEWKSILAKGVMRTWSHGSCREKS